MERARRSDTLRDISKYLGRFREIFAQCKRNGFAYGRGEKYSLELGNDLSRALTSELAMLATPQTQPLFLRKYQRRQIKQYRRREPIYKGAGDIVCCLDESGSTSGELASWGKAVALALLEIAESDGRKFALVHFSGPGSFKTDIFLPKQYSMEDKIRAAETFLDGGTDFHTPLNEALRLIQEDGFENADIVFITDGECDLSENYIEELRTAQAERHFTVTGVLLDQEDSGMDFSLKAFCQNIYRTSELTGEQVVQGLKEELAELCDSMCIPYTSGNRLSVSDAFRSATGDIRVRVPVTEGGETNIYLAYCRDNKRTAEILSRELVKETMNRQTNQYEKLANISYDKVDGVFRCDNMVMDDAVDVRECCRKAEELFELYQSCANRKQIETICTNFLRGIEATKLSITGHMYFVPRTYMERVDIFEDFITLLSGLNKKQTPLVVNSFYIIDDAKQRDKMTEEFYLAVKKEIATYQEKCDYLIKSGSQSPAVMDRWVLKVQALEQKKRHYEGVLQRELDGLDDEFSVLKFLSQELQVRANSIRSQRFPTKKAA